MSKVKLTITESRCRCGYVKGGDIFIIDDLCPPIYNGGSISLNGDAYIGYGVAIISYVNTYENLNDALNVMCYAPYYSGRVVVYVDADITCHGNVYIPAECDLIIVDGAHLDLNGYRVICDGSFVE